MSELGPEARSVVDAGRAGDDPTGRDRARVRAALMTAIAAGGAGAAAVVGEGAAAAGVVKGVTTVGVLGALGWGWQAAVFGLATLGALGTTVVVMGASSDAPSSTPAPLVAASSTQAPMPRVAPASPGPPEAPAVPVVAPSAEAARSPSSTLAPAPHGSSLAHRGADEGEPRLPPASETAAPSPLPVDPLVAETRGLGEAHGALKDGDPALALALLDQQSTAYANGQLREERAAARILALCKLGRADEARALAATFLAKNPRSVLADRVRAACPAGGSR